MEFRKEMQTKELPDDQNPMYLFNCPSTELLIQIATGKINTVELARKQLENMGFNENGKYIGF